MDPVDCGNHFRVCIDTYGVIAIKYDNDEEGREFSDSTFLDSGQKTALLELLSK